MVISDTNKRVVFAYNKVAANNGCKVGVFGDEGTPVPIPNTAVKLISAENTLVVTPREDRAMPTQIFLYSSVGRACGC